MTLEGQSYNHSHFEVLYHTLVNKHYWQIIICMGSPAVSIKLIGPSSRTLKGQRKGHWDSECIKHLVLLSNDPIDYY